MAANGVLVIEAILFDFGGVFTRSPFDAVRTNSAKLGLDPELVVTICFGSYDSDTDHAWHRMERGELSMADCRAELMKLAADHGHELDPFTLLAGGGAEDAQREGMVERTRVLRARGYRTGVVTNNVKEYGAAWRGMVPVDELFDVIIDSSMVGVRKPDPRIFHLALDALGGLSPERAAFLDDVPGNVAAAQALGIHGVIVGEDRLAAMDELEKLLS